MHPPAKHSLHSSLSRFLFTSAFGRLHRDQQGAMSFVTVFTVLMLAMLLGMMLNVCKIADEKIRMQDAVDASTYSSGVIMARAMNSLAFTNHLLCDVFALTAFLRVGSEVNDGGNSNAADDLALLKNSAFEQAGKDWPMDDELGATHKLPALPQQNWNGLPKALLHGSTQNRAMIESFSPWVRNFSDEVLPSLESILENKLIPEYQQMLTEDIQSMVEQTATQTAQRNMGYTDDQKETDDQKAISASIWKTNGSTTGGWKFGDDNIPQTVPAGLPVVDANTTKNPFYKDIAIAQRKRLSENYLAQWNREKTLAFDALDGMSNFSAIWRNFTEKQLEILLLEENADRNLLHVIWTPGQNGDPNPPVDDEDLRTDVSFNYTPQQRNDLIRDCYTFVGVLKKQQFHPFMPSLFTNPLSDEKRMTFAQGMLFLAIPRLTYQTFPEPCCKITISNPDIQFQQGTPTIKTGRVSTRIEYTGPQMEGIRRQHRSMEWNLLNQSWQFKLCPAQCNGLEVILSHHDPAMQTLQADDLKCINTH